MFLLLYLLFIKSSLRRVWVTDLAPRHPGTFSLDVVINKLLTLLFLLLLLLFVVVVVFGGGGGGGSGGVEH